MRTLETNLKAAGAIGALVFILYCLSISFLPSEVSLGDVIPLLLLLAQFVFSLAWYALLFALAGAFFWYLAKIIYFILLPFRLVLALILLSVVALRARRTGAIFSSAIKNVSSPFPVRAHPLLALIGLCALTLLLNSYLSGDSGFLLPGFLPGVVFQLLAVLSGCMYVFVVLQHLAGLYMPAFLRRRATITSPVFRLFPHMFLLNPQHAHAKVSLAAVVVLLLFFPGGYDGLLALTATSAGLRAEDTVVVLQKASTYAPAVKDSGNSKCRLYVAQQEGDVLVLRGVTLLFHGIGKKSLLLLPAMPDMKRVEVRSEDLRSFDEPLRRSWRDYIYWFRIYSMTSLVDIISDRAISRIFSNATQGESLEPIFRMLEMFVPSPNAVADAVVSEGPFVCLFTSLPIAVGPDETSVAEQAVAHIRMLGRQP